MIKKEKVTRFCAVGFFLIFGMLVFGTLLAEDPPSSWHTRDFSVMTWNIHWDFFQTPDENRARQQSNTLKIAAAHPIFVGIQEDFLWEAYEKMPQSTSAYGYSYNFSIAPSGNGTVQYGNGLTAFYDFPFQSQSTEIVEWNNCFGVVSNNNDCLARKGFAYSKIGIFDEYSESGAIHFYFLHMDASRGDGDIATRKRQLNQLSEFMNQHSKGYPVIIMGDFNLEGLIYKHSEDLTTMNDFIAADNQGLTMANDDPLEPTCDINSPDPSKYDYFLFRPGNDPNINLEKLACHVMDKMEGSDHQPLLANFRYSVNFDAFPDLTVTSIEFEKMSEGIWNAYVTVKNLGPSASPVATPIRVNVQIQGDKTVTGFNHISALANGQSSTIDIGLENCYPPEGTFTVIAIVDKYDEIKENNGINNVMQKAFVNGAVPEAPVLNSPANNASVCTTTPTLKWTAVTATPAVDYYQVQINNAAGTKIYASGNLTTTTFSVPAGILQNSATYGWYVRAHNSLGWGAWSGRTLQIGNISVPPQPSLSSPVNNETVCTKTPTLKWGAVGACPAVDYYQVQINNAAGSKIYASGNLTTTTFVVPASILNSSTTYAWYVRAHNSSGWSAWSGRTINIGNIGVPATPVLISPGNNVTVYTLTPTLKWEAVSACPAVNYYQLQIKYTDGTVAYTSGNLTSTIFTVPEEVLYGGTTYLWYVRAHNASGWSGWIGRTIKIYQNE